MVQHIKDPHPQSEMKYVCINRTFEKIEKGTGLQVHTKTRKFPKVRTAPDRTK